MPIQQNKNKQNYFFMGGTNDKNFRLSWLPNHAMYHAMYQETMQTVTETL